MRCSYLFYACDPGGANAIVPIIKYFENIEECIVCGKNRAILIFENEGIKSIDVELIENCESEIDSLLSQYSPKVVITGTSPNDFFEKKMWIAARERSIKTIAVIDHWTMLGYRFSKHTLRENKEFEIDHDLSYTPDYIFVIDDYSKGELVKLGLPDSKIYVMGNPHFEYYRRQVESISADCVQQYKQRINAGDKKIILFASDNISEAFDEKENSKELYWGYNEKTIFGCVKSILDQRIEDDYIVVIKPHPKEDIQYWYKLNLNKNKYIIDEKTDTQIVLKASDIVISMQSMVLIEAALCGKRYMSVQIGLKRENPFILSKLGIARTILNDKELNASINDFFTEKYNCSEWNLCEDSIKRIVKFIGELK